MLRKEHAADAFQSMYAQMACGLCQRHAVLRVGTVFASGLLRAIHFLQLHWEQLATDIEAGALTPRVADPSVREAVAAILRPDLELARFLHAECSRGDWAGIVTRVWPNAESCARLEAPAARHQHHGAFLDDGCCSMGGAPSAAVSAEQHGAAQERRRPGRRGKATGAGAARRGGDGRGRGRGGAGRAGVGARGERRKMGERGRDDMWDPLLSWQKKRKRKPLPRHLKTTKTSLEGEN